MTYEEFWQRYLAGHAERRTRAVHYLSTGSAVACIAVAALTRGWRLAVSAPFVGYGRLWLAHAAFERNRPETFSHPIWSLLSDYRMLGLFLAGRLAAELRRAPIPSQ